MKKLYIMCDGGFGNRLGALIPGLILANKWGREPIISWPITRWCECSFNDIFQNAFNVDEKSIDELFEEKKNAHFLIHHNISTDKKVKLENQYDVHSDMAGNYMDHLDGVDGDIVFTNHIIPTRTFKEEVVLEYLRKLKLKSSIIERVEEIYKSFPSITYGIHIRKTDFPQQFLLDDNMIVDLIKTNSEQKFFICSDDNDTEAELDKLENVIINKKTSSVVTKEDRFDISRPKDSVIDGIIDMLLLSRTKITNQNHQSTFLVFAFRYGTMKLEELK